MFKFDMLLFLKTMMTHKIRTALIVPPVALALARHPIVDKFDLSALSRVVTGAAPFPAAISEAITKRFGVISVQGYGLTETTPFISLCPLKEPVHGSIGVLAPNIEARIVDAETGKDVGAGEAGELWVRGPNVMVGYHNNAEATAASIDADGYFHTGDVAIISAEGYLTIVDRLKELIKYGGLQVAPAELEAKLLSYPKIADAAVIGCPDEAVGELPLAFVVMHPGQTATEAEIQTFIAGQVAQHKQLRGGVVLIDAIPRAASGKILRRVLREKLSVALAATKTA
ncbi:luciferase [Entophlyctis helioformis]|nr:luciferase [Entophlyctis helioformis]